MIYQVQRKTVVGSVCVGDITSTYRLWLERWWIISGWASKMCKKLWSDAVLSCLQTMLTMSTCQIQSLEPTAPIKVNHLHYLTVKFNFGDRGPLTDLGPPCWTDNQIFHHVSQLSTLFWDSPESQRRGAFTDCQIVCCQTMANLELRANKDWNRMRHKT